MKKLICAALILAACSDPVGSAGLQVRPEKAFYAVFGDLQVVTVRYTVVNSASTTALVSTCGPSLTVAIQRKTNGEWVTLMPPTVMCFDASSRAIEPGGAVTDSVTVQGPGTWRVLVPYGRPGDEFGEAESTEFSTGFPPD